MNSRVQLVPLLVIVLAACAGTPGPTPSAQATYTSAPTQEPSSSPTPAETQAVSTIRWFRGDGFSFAYPDTWREISGYQHAGRHGPSVLAAVGVGDFELGCTSTADSVTCGPAPRWSVPTGGVVLAYRFDAWLGPIAPQPTPVLGPGERWVDVAGRAAVVSQTERSMRWHFPGAPEYIEARWDGAIAADARAEVESVVASWTWTPQPTARPNPGPSEVTFPLQPDWPGNPTMTAGRVMIPAAGRGGCGAVYYRARGYAADSCGPDAFPLDTSPTKVAAGALLVIAYANGARVTDRTWAGEPAEFSVLASPADSLRDLPVGQQQQLPDGRGRLDLGAHVGSSGEVLATAPATPGDYLVQVRGVVRVGDWTWTKTRFYYRLLVPAPSSPTDSRPEMRRGSRSAG